VQGEMVDSFLRPFCDITWANQPEPTWGIIGQAFWRNRVKSHVISGLTLHAPDWPYASSSRATFAWSSPFGARALCVAIGQRVMLPLARCGKAKARLLVAMAWRSASVWTVQPSAEHSKGVNQIVRLNRWPQISTAKIKQLDSL
jgi:hypothetical protein